MLTLDSTTLFYWNLSDNPKKRKLDDLGLQKWARSVPKGSKPESHSSIASTSKQGNTASRSIPSLTGCSTAVSSTSFLSSDINIKQTRSSSILPPRVVIDAPQLPDAQGLSDNDETQGQERDFATFSPPKGQVRIASDVISTHFHIDTTLKYIHHRIGLELPGSRSNWALHLLKSPFRLEPTSPPRRLTWLIPELLLLLFLPLTPHSPLKCPLPTVYLQTYPSTTHNSRRVLHQRCFAAV